MMKPIFLGLICVALLVEASLAKSLSEQWAAYKHQFGKKYDNPAEEARRFANFLNTKTTIEQHNLDASQSYTLGLNHMADWHPEELARLGGARRSADDEQRDEMTPDEKAFLDDLLSGDDELPDEVDWRKVPGRVSDVKDQGDCGSCWAFSAIGLLEGQELVQNKSRKTLVPLSVQELVDCSSSNQACDGGFPAKALDDLVKLGGVESEADYRYTASHDNCTSDKSRAIMRNISGSIQLPPKDEDTLKRVVAKYGPVSVAVATATGGFHFYRNGVFSNKQCELMPLDHAVLIIGYGVDKQAGPYWIVKNSWGTDWGEQGYMRIKRGVNMCFIALVTVIAKFN